MHRLIAVPTALLALAAASCGDTDGGRDPTAAASSAAGTAPGPDETLGEDPGSASPTVPGQPMNCGDLRDALGKAGDVTLYADPAAGGTVECGEARRVMSEFFLRVPHEGRDDRGTLAVRGWFCQYESGPTGTWITTCRKGEREMHTEEPTDQPSGEPGGPDGSQLPTLPGAPSDPMDEPSTEEL
ncbi:hypothetical protein AB0G60_16345 [Streptomyces angustmyceticus]|uniref:Lipoprotein n=1 Tax=Streptomyces angustmyceticus TaxID=285578 RepID=A0A5J4LMX6_9ACTN|nr:hypothetical protein [Streptomyces angustmyceticus]UAL70319.1 hypothetical protein K7396_30240 [Streptomyces angustmyceticus]GES33352.1 hypothetical protein San01_58400 [Streptomyces angustmyceticus]